CETNACQTVLSHNPDEAGSRDMSLLTPANRQKWSGGDALAWASESYGIAKAKVYRGVVDHAPVETGFIFLVDGRPDEKCGPSNVYSIASDYESTAKGVVEEQLAKAGLRLAGILKESFP